MRGRMPAYQNYSLHFGALRLVELRKEADPSKPSHLFVGWVSGKQKIGPATPFRSLLGAPPLFSAENTQRSIPYEGRRDRPKQVPP